MTLRDDAYNRAKGQCECAVKDCGHSARCSGPLRGEWEIRRIDPAQPLTLNNVVAICHACYRHVRGSSLGPLPGF